MEKNDNKMSKREVRRKRRIKSQIATYATFGVILIAFIIGFFCGIRSIVSWVNERSALIQAERDQEIETLQDEEVAAAAEAENEEDSTVVEEEEDPIDEMVDGLIGEMSLEEKAASIFIIHPESITGVDVVVQAGEGTKSALEKYAVGGFVYRAENVSSKDQFKQMLQNTNSYSKFPLFYAVSEESGSGTFAGIEALGIEQTETAEILAESGDNNSIYSAYSSIGSYLSELGINLNFAPVADVLTNQDNSELAGRTFGSDFESAKEMVAFATDALQQKGVSATLMHFPGEGDIETGEQGVAVTNKSLTELKSSEFLTFQAGIDAGAEFVMVSNICAPTVTGETLPCSMSTVIMQDILRDDMKFKGIIITEAMNQENITSQYSSGEAAIAALNAGADMILEPDNFEEAYQGIVDALSDGTISEERINEALHHIFYVKYKNALDE